MYLHYVKRYLPVFLMLMSGIALAELNTAAYSEAYPDTIDPFTGNWLGQWVNADMDDPEISAQVYALGGDRYRVTFKHRFDVRCPIQHVVDEAAEGAVLEFKNETFFGKFENERFVGGRSANGDRFEMKKVDVVSPTMGKKAPRRSVKLFDGTNLKKWRKTKGWDVTDRGTLVVTPGASDLLTEDGYRDVELHLEFRLPYVPTGRGQDRGNSGVHLQSAYEVQILDSFGLEGLYDECGSLYKIAAPKVNMCLPPLAWQTYDITYRGPRYGRKGKMKSVGEMTVYHNGVLVHHEVELPWRTGGGLLHKNRHPENHPQEKQSIKLQEHSHYMEFRNIWLVEK